MSASSNTVILRNVGLALVLAVGTSSHAQVSLDPDSLSRNSFIWNQEEIITGFLHYDEVFEARDVPSGGMVHKLPSGLPIAAYSEGGEREKELEEFLSTQKVAGLLILQDEKIRLERYALGYSEAGRWTSQSVAKSVTSTLVGIAIKDGYIHSVDDYVTDYIPGLLGSAYDSVTVHHLLTMTTGIRWTEDETDPNSDLVRFSRCRSKLEWIRL